MKKSSGHESVVQRTFPRPGISALAMSLARITNGHDPEAADELIRAYSAALQKGTLFAHGLGPNEKVFLDYIQYAFGRYVDGKPLDAAFGFKLWRGEKDRDISIEDRNLAIAASVELLVRKDMQARGISKPRHVMEKYKNGNGRMISKVKMEPIYAVVGKKFNLSAKTIERIFRDYEAAVESTPIDTLALLAGHLMK